MTDPRFYESLPAVSVQDLALMSGARLHDGVDSDLMILGVASLEAATPGIASFCGDQKHAAALASTAAAACFIPANLLAFVPHGCAPLVTRHPQAAFAMAAGRLVRPLGMTPGAPNIDPTAHIEDGAVISPGAIIGPGAAVGRGTAIGAGAVVGPGVMIGRDCLIGPRVVLGFAMLGDRVRVHAGAVIGEPGFGAAPAPFGLIDMPQLGRVILQDGVTIGANSCVDRGAFDDTVIGENTKIDNLVQIAHNVVIGRNCVVAAHSGISGSTQLGDGCMLGGRVGITDHIRIGAGVRLAAASGVMKNVPAGETWGGTPARPIGRWMRETALIARLAQRKRSGGTESS